jgi:ABC-type uncharacterized transport system ATPase subunit
MTYALLLGFFRNDFGFGGNNGLTDFKDILGFNVQADGTRAALFALSCAGAGARLPDLPRGRDLETRQGADRDPRRRIRTRFLGYRVESYKLFVFTLSACMAGVAGALYVPQVGIINPGEFAPGNSIEAVIWVAVGGRGTLIGAALGAVVVNYAKTWFTSGAAGAVLAVHAGRAVHPGHAASCRRASSAPSTRGGSVRGARPNAAKAPRAKTASANRIRRSERMNVMEPAPPALLYLDGVTRLVRRLPRLNNLSLTLEPGEMRAIIGPNGAGKTTMMDVITGKTRPDEGDVLFDGVTDLTRLDEAASPNSASAANSRSRRCSRATPSRTICCWRSSRSQRGHAVLARRDQPRSRAHRRACWKPSADGPRARARRRLSHGQKQWLEIGMLLAQDPKLLLVDEPVAGMTDVETASDRGAAQGDQPRQDRGRGRARHDLRARARRQGDLPARRARCWPKAPSIRCAERARRSKCIWGDEHAEGRRIDLHYGAAQALRGVSLTAEPGKVTCVLGRNGVGKTSAAARDGRPASDRKRLDHASTAPTSPAQALRARAARHRLSCRRAARSFRC